MWEEEGSITERETERYIFRCELGKILKLNFRQYDRSSASNFHEYGKQKTLKKPTFVRKTHEHSTKSYAVFLFFFNQSQNFHSEHLTKPLKMHKLFKNRETEIQPMKGSGQ